MDKEVIDGIKAFMEKVIIDLQSRYQTTEGSDWKRGAGWGLKRGEQIMQKRLKELGTEKVVPTVYIECIYDFIITKRGFPATGVIAITGNAINCADDKEKLVGMDILGAIAELEELLKHNGAE